MKQRIFHHSAVLFFICSAFVVNAQTYSLDSSAVVFEIKNAGITVDGVFNAPEMKLQLSANNMTAMKLSGTVQTASINTGIGLRDKHLRDEKYFDVEKYPVIRMELKRMDRIRGNEFNGQFQLSMKGTTKEVPVKITVRKNDDELRMIGTFEINRLDYNVGGNSLFLGNEVIVTVVGIFQK